MVVVEAKSQQQKLVLIETLWKTLPGVSIAHPCLERLQEIGKAHDEVYTFMNIEINKMFSP